MRRVPSVLALPATLGIAFPLAFLLGLSLLGVRPVLAADDVTPPTGTLTLNGGAAFANNPGLTVDAPATDDLSGVASLALSDDGTTWTEFGGIDHTVWNLPSSAEGKHTVYARWTDVAGNVSAPTSASIVLDLSPPVGSVELHDLDSYTRIAVLDLAFKDVGPSGLDDVAVRCGDGPATTLAYAKQIKFLVTKASGDACRGYGEKTLYVEVRDRAGNVQVAVVSVLLYPQARLSFPSPAVTGKSFTVRPLWPDGEAPPSGTVCRWEFRWGDDASLFDNNADETFGGLLFEGPLSKGFCGDWTFTLPWVPVRQFDVWFSADGSVTSKVFKAAVGSTDRHISSSNLPMVYVLPSRYDLIVGEPVTYTLYRLGGVSIGTTGRWIANLVGSGATTGTEHFVQQVGGTTFTFTPDVPGSWVVGWDAGSGRAYVLSGYYDPPARRRSGSGGGSGGGGARATPAPVVTAPAVASDGPASAPPPSASLPGSVGPSPSTATPSASPEPTAAPVAAASLDGAARTAGAASTAHPDGSFPVVFAVFALAAAAAVAAGAVRWRRRPRV